MARLTPTPALHAFLSALRPGDLLSGTVTAIESFGVFVALDDGPDHPVFPGVGFVSPAELSWRSFRTAADVVRVGQRVTGEFLQYDTWNLEARLSLKATRPDPFPAFAEDTPVGRVLRGKVTKQVPFGTFVEVADGIEGLVHREDHSTGDVEVGQEVAVAVVAVEPDRRRLHLRMVEPPREEGRDG